MGRGRPFTIIPRDLETPPEELARVVKQAGETVPDLVVEKENYRSRVVTVSLPENQVKRAAEILGDGFILSANTDLKLIK